MQRNGWIQQMTDNNRQKDRSSNTDNGLEKVLFSCLIARHGVDIVRYNSCIRPGPLLGFWRPCPKVLGAAPSFPSLPFSPSPPLPPPHSPLALDAPLPGVFEARGKQTVSRT